MAMVVAKTTHCAQVGHGAMCFNGLEVYPRPLALGQDLRIFGQRCGNARGRKPAIRAGAHEYPSAHPAVLVSLATFFQEHPAASIRPHDQGARCQPGIRVDFIA